MFHLQGYYRAMRQYLSTPKGAHDSKDYVRAVLLIVLTIAAVYLLLYMWGGIR